MFYGHIISTSCIKEGSRPTDMYIVSITYMQISCNLILKPQRKKERKHLSLYGYKLVWFESHYMWTTWRRYYICCIQSDNVQSYVHNFHYAPNIAICSYTISWKTPQLGQRLTNSNTLVRKNNCIWEYLPSIHIKTHAPYKHDWIYPIFISLDSPIWDLWN